MCCQPNSLPHFQGRLNLEQQRKRAKELLPRLKSQDPNATLSQAQWQVAKQLGFSSWPKLKAHVDALDFAARHPAFDASDEARTTHWRCGNGIAHSLQVAGLKGQFRMLTDPLCMGPVRDLPSEAFRVMRSAFISQAFALDPVDVARRVNDEYHQLEALANADHSVLWCGADAYDQLFLIRALAGLEQAPHKLELIEVFGTEHEWPRRALTLTPLGHAVLNGDAYWLDHASHERWVGGVCLRPRQPHWTLGDDHLPVWRG
ncbi:DUF1835 domain-containing protein [Pseudomonas antarctica]|uniref:DUF1835 domain-containing protein n=1 Tax=Pseudomonas antarctica TaxID=219572 RepID=UPI0039C481F5